MKYKKKLIIAGRLLLVDEGRTAVNQHILIEGERISSIHDASDVPADCEVIDLSSYTVLPGLIDCHTHLTLPPTFRDLADELARSPALSALQSIPNARTKLESGFTTVREAGSYWAFVDVALGQAIDAGHVLGPRLLAPGAMITMSGGAGAMTGLAHEIELPRSLRFGAANGTVEARQRVREVVSYGASHIKTFASGAVMQHGCCSPAATEFTFDELEAIVDEARNLEVRVMAHAHAPKGIRNAVKAGVASIEHGTMLDREGGLMMRDQGVFLVPTLSVWDSMGDETRRPADFIAKARSVQGTHDGAFQLALELGVPIALGSDSAVSPHDRGAREIHHMVRLGMSEMAAIQASTVHAATLLDRPEVGVIAKGRYADIIAVEGNPLENIDTFTQVPFVMKGGSVVKEPEGASA